MKKLLSVMAIFLMAAVVAFPPAAHAVATLMLSDGIPTDTLTITDNGLNDSNPAVGVITYIGSIGVWTINVTTGQSFSPNGLGSERLDVNSVDTSSGAGTLVISFSDTGFTLPNGINTFVMGIGGTTAGTVQNAAYVGTDNSLFSQTGTIGTTAAFGPGAFSGTLTGNVTTANPSSLTEVITITQTGAGTTSFDAALNIPLPPTALLLSSGLVGIILLGRRRKAKA